MIHHHPSRSGSPLGRMLSLIQAPNNTSLRFLITDCPTESTLTYYLEEFKRYNVTHVVRCCQPTYATARLTHAGIQVHDIPFKDGGVPPPQMVLAWLNIIANVKEGTIAVHCVAGLGRAPALVAMALIELGMPALDAIEYIREKRRGALNKPQIAYLDAYKPTLFIKKPNNLIGKMFSFSYKKKAVTTH
jgi:protein tyrosine phosphatase type 4A